MTSANISEEPICYQNEECIHRLSKIADYFLFHNRDIFIRCDDSVMRLFRAKSFFLRRSRGYTPRPILLMKKGKSVLAVGGHLKNTICYTKDRFAFMSQHVGDLENMPTLDVFEETIEHMNKLFEIDPSYIIHDLHPDYLSSKWVQENAKVPTCAIQHHYAHILSVMAEHGIEDNLVGFSLDGTGFGEDGTIWGGEVLICNLRSFHRYAHFETIPMPGGEKAIHEPWRMAVSYLVRSFGMDSDIIQKLFPDKAAQIDIILQMILKGLNSPLTSSCGRLFDAVAAILGLRETVSYEGQAAIQLEAIAEKADQNIDYKIGEFQLAKKSDRFIIDPRDVITNIVKLKLAGESDNNLSKAFHNTLIKIFSRIASQILNEMDIKVVALSGGCFQNMLLLNGLHDELEQRGFNVFTNHQVPVNDGGLALGQAYWGMHNCGRINT
jgi:hydrogenase maturation protein HypF